MNHNKFESFFILCPQNQASQASYQFCLAKWIKQAQIIICLNLLEHKIETNAFIHHWSTFLAHSLSQFIERNITHGERLTNAAICTTDETITDRLSLLPWKWKMDADVTLITQTTTRSSVRAWKHTAKNKALNSTSDKPTS
jgi:uncharacterized protein VirK/YbjX